MSNHNLVLVSGKSATGKSFSLNTLKNPEGVLYINCESNKSLPFKSRFNEVTLTDPLKLFKAFVNIENNKDVHTIVIDSLTYLMDMYETLYVLTAQDMRRAWGEYAQYFKKLMQQYVASSTKNVIFLAHTADIYNETELILETYVKVKGSLNTQGIESYFTSVISTKKLSVKKLEDYSNDLLSISEDDKLLGVKYLYQTKLNKDTVNERIRSPYGMWSNDEIFINNDLQSVLDRIHKYYNS
jgi:hypothetical protein